MNSRMGHLSNRQLKFPEFAINTVFFSLVCLSIIPICSCSNQEASFFKNGKRLTKASISVNELQRQLDEFEEVFTSRTKTAATEIDRLSVDPKIMKMTLLWRSRAIPALHKVFEQQQPMVILVDSWLLCIRLANYIESGEAANIFGDFQPIALATSKELETQIEDIARNVLSEELFNQTASSLRSLALANLIQSGFNKTLMYSTQMKKGQPSVFESVINIPLSPVRALEGVDRTPSAIYDFSNTTRRLTDVVQELPDSARWQLLLLLYDIEEINMIKSFLMSLQNIADSSTKLSAIAEKLPALLEDAGQSQDQIRQTLKQANETSVQIRLLFDSAKQTAAVFSQTAHDVNLAAASWTDAARATDEAIRQFKPQKTQSGAEAVAKVDLKETAQAIKEAAIEIKLVSKELPTQTEQLIIQINSLATQITIKIVILILLVFSLLFAYYFIRKMAVSAKK